MLFIVIVQLYLIYRTVQAEAFNQNEAARVCEECKGGKCGRNETTGDEICVCPRGYGWYYRKWIFVEDNFCKVKPVIRRFENITMKENVKATLLCEAFGEPEPILTIRKDNNNPFGENQDSRVSLETNFMGDSKILRLNIQHLRRTDDGLYFCSARNNAGEVVRAGHIEVFFAPNMSSTPSTTVKTWASNPTNLSCIAEANPNATITWLFRNEKIPDNSLHYITYGGTSYSNLLVKIGENPSATDVFGIYKCEAQNALGKASVEIHLELATEPDIISQVVFEEVKPTTITFIFLGPSDTGCLPLLGYVVKFWETNEREENAIRHEWTKSSPYIVTNMKPRVKYSFKFAAKNAVGIGQEKLIFYKMPTEQAPDPPTFITKDEAVSDYADKFEIKWSIPNDNGAKIQHFGIRFFKVERTINGWKDISQQATVIRIESWENPVFELINLSPNTWYKVELRAHNRLGSSFPGYLAFRTRSEVNNSTDTSVEWVEN